MKRMIRIIVLISSITLFLSIITIVVSPFLSSLHIKSIQYSYRYFDENGNINVDTVLITGDDAQTIASMFQHAKISFAWDTINAGYDHNHYLRLNGNWISCKILLRYNHLHDFKNEFLRIEYCINEEEAKSLYRILQSYHRHDSVLIAG